MDLDLFYYHRGEEQDLYSFQILVKNRQEHIPLYKKQNGPDIGTCSTPHRIYSNRTVNQKMLTQNICDKQRRSVLLCFVLF